MNSIRINRYNAFLYRVTSALPQEHQVYRVVHASLLAFMVNDRNFEEEEGTFLEMKMKKCSCPLRGGPANYCSKLYKQDFMNWFSIFCVTSSKRS